MQPFRTAIELTLIFHDGLTAAGRGQQFLIFVRLFSWHGSDITKFTIAYCRAFTFAMRFLKLNFRLKFPPRSLKSAVGGSIPTTATPSSLIEGKIGSRHPNGAGPTVPHQVRQNRYVPYRAGEEAVLCRVRWVHRCPYRRRRRSGSDVWYVVLPDVCVPRQIECDVKHWFFDDGLAAGCPCLGSAFSFMWERIDHVRFFVGTD